MSPTESDGDATEQANPDVVVMGQNRTKEQLFEGVQDGRQWILALQPFGGNQLHYGFGGGPIGWGKDFLQQFGFSEGASGSVWSETLSQSSQHTWKDYLAYLEGLFIVSKSGEWRVRRRGQPCPLRWTNHEHDDVVSFDFNYAKYLR